MYRYKEKQRFETERENTNKKMKVNMEMHDSSVFASELWVLYLFFTGAKKTIQKKSEISRTFFLIIGLKLTSDSHQNK